MDYSQPGIYDATDTTFSPGMSAGGSGEDNATALQAAVDYAEAHGGGIILIPSNDDNNELNNYLITSPDGGGYCVSISGEYPLAIMGTGGATLLTVQHNVDLFDVAPGNFTGSSLTFQDFFVQYNANQTEVVTAFNLSGCENVRLLRVGVKDAPTAINLQNIQGASLEHVYVTYGEDFDATDLPATALKVGPDGSGNPSGQIEIVASAFDVTHHAMPSISTGILVTGVDGLCLESVHLSEFLSGMAIEPSDTSVCSNITAKMLQIDSQGAVTIEPQSAEASVNNVSFYGCAMNGSRLPLNGVVIKPNGGSVANVRLVNCNVFNYANYGLLLYGGQYIAVVGGLYASNGAAGIYATGPATNIVVDGPVVTKSAYVLPGAMNLEQPNGIVITASESGTPSHISINGAVITGHASTGVTLSGVDDAQLRNCVITENGSYGISVTDLCSDASIDNCVLTNNGAPIYASSPGALQITNCPGYNDQVNHLGPPAVPPSGTPFNGPYFNYYGGVTFYASALGPLTIEIGGTNTHLSNGTFYIVPPSAGAPGTVEEAMLTYAAAPNFLALGD